jgi:hypothetical protein
MGSIPDWYALFKSAFTSCKPGGYVESLESAPWLESDDGTVLESSALAGWGQLFVKGSEKLGRTFTIVDDELQRKGMEAAGFVDIQEYNKKVCNPIRLVFWSHTQHIPRRCPWVHGPKTPS